MNAMANKEHAEALERAQKMLKDAEDFILVTLDDENMPVLAFYTDILTMAQTAVLTLRTVKNMLDDPETTQEEREAVALILGMSTDNESDK